jgi:hypothetical protein
MSQASQKRNLMLLAVFVGLILIAVFVADPFGWRKQSSGDKQAQSKEQLTLIDAGADAISSIEIDPPDAEPFTLTKEKDTWFAVQGEKRYRANMDKVTPMLDQLPGAKSEAIATDKADKYEDLELTPEKAYGLKVFAGGPEPKSTLLVGKAAEGFKASFVRVGEGKEVYRSGVNIRQLIAFSFDDYRTRKPWTFDPEMAEELRVKRPPVQEKLPPKGEGMAGEPKKDDKGFVLETQAPEPLVFSKKDGVWKLPDGRNANQNLIKELLKNLSELQINEYAEGKTDADTGFSAATQPSIVVKTPAGEYSIALAPENAGNRYVRDQDGLVYRMSSYAFHSYLDDLKFDELSFDDTKKDEAKTEEGAAAEDSAKGDESKKDAAADGAADAPETK